MTPINDTNPGARPAPRVPRQTPTGRSRAQRARALRRRVISGALALFVASWLLIAVVLVSGHDPALAKKTTVANTASTQTTGTTTAASATPTTTTTTSSTPTTTTSSTGSTGSSGNSSGGSAGAVTTRQS